MPALRQNLNGEMRRHFAQMHRAQVVGALVTGRWCGHVGNHEIRRAAQRFHQQARGLVLKEVHLHEMHAWQCIHFQKVDGRDANVGVGRIRHLGGNLRPASWCRAKVDDALGVFEDMVLIVDLQQLEGRASAIPFELCPLDVRVVDMAL